MIHRPNKLLGQHFLTSPEVLTHIIEVSRVRSSETVLEIGPGTGILTKKLSEKAKKVISIEKDLMLFEQLQQEIIRDGVRNVTLIHGDILKLPTETLGLPAAFSVVSNIPYYLTGRLIRLLLDHEPQPERMALMVQKEVAERIVAKPPSMNMLALSVQAYGTPKIEFFVPASAFSPKPKVDSAVITIGSISRAQFQRHTIRPEAFFRIARTSFRGKRKIMENTLTSLFEPQCIGDVLKNLHLEKQRPQELSLDTWFELAKALQPCLITDQIRSEP